MKNVLFVALLALVACSAESVEPVVAPPTESPPKGVMILPVVPEAPPAKFAVGDKVYVEGENGPDGKPLLGTVVDVGEVMNWTFRTTGETVDSRLYVVTFEISVDGFSRLDNVMVPEVALRKP